jgi:hypothetical protein
MTREGVDREIAYQFRAGQLVRLCRSIRHNGAEGDYEIVRRLPDEDGDESRAYVSRMNVEHAPAEF